MGLAEKSRWYPFPTISYIKSGSNSHNNVYHPVVDYSK